MLAIAIIYGSHISLLAPGFAGAGIGLILLLQWLRVRSVLPYGVLGGKFGWRT